MPYYSSDDATLDNYMKLCNNIPDIRTAMRIFINCDFHEVYELLSNHIFKNGMNSQKSEAHLSMILLAAFEYNYGLPFDSRLKAFYQSGGKKFAITTNETRLVNSNDAPIGRDRHVSIVATEFLKEECCSATKSELDTLVDMLCSSGTLSPSIALWVNELLGQLAHFLQAGKDSNEEKFALAVLSSIITAYPSRYDAVIDKMCKTKHQRKHLFSNSDDDNDEGSSSKRRKTRQSSRY